MIQKHCFECGTALIEKELEEEGIVPYCPKCQQYRFPMYNVAVSMIVVDEETGKILLIQQYGKPSYILVAGYVNRGEAEEHAVVREVREETGLEVEHLRSNRTKFFEPSNTKSITACRWMQSRRKLILRYIKLLLRKEKSQKKNGCSGSIFCLLMVQRSLPQSSWKRISETLRMQPFGRL